MNRISAYHRYALDQSLLERHLLRRGELTDERARQHLVAGFNRRLLMLQMSRRTIEDITHSPTNRPIGSYKATELATHLNSYYLNLCGALDNLTWAMQYEWQLLPRVDEDSAKRQQVALFGKSFLRAMADHSANLAESIIRFSDWHYDLRAMRDPAAHRIPIFAVPGVMDENQAARFRELQELSADKARHGDHDGMMELQFQSYALGGYQPWMTLWSPSGERFLHAWNQVLADHDHFQKLATLLSEAILPEQTARR